MPISEKKLSPEVSSAQFICDYWQRSPLLIRNSCLLLPESFDKKSILEYATDSRLASRLVNGHMAAPDEWNVQYGPFRQQQFTSPPDNPWTLLIQDMDKVNSECAHLLDQFDFLPRWRLDDVMASYAVAGGSVGPHTDQYDVFLIQLSGQRHWQWAEHTEARYLPNSELRILQSFTPEHEALLNPGDMLYLPPGVAHHGVAHTDCITLSVGLRAPSDTELLSGLLDFWTNSDSHANHEDNRYSDQDLNPEEQSELSTAVAQRLRLQMRRLFDLSDANLLDSFGQFITQYRLAEDLLQWSTNKTIPKLTHWVRRQPAARLAWRKLSTQPEHAKLYCNGEQTTCSIAAAKLICNQITFRLNELAAVSADSDRLIDWLFQYNVISLTANRSA